MALTQERMMAVIRAARDFQKTDLALREAIRDALNATPRDAAPLPQWLEELFEKISIALREINTKRESELTIALEEQHFLLRGRDNARQARRARIKRQAAKGLVSPDGNEEAVRSFRHHTAPITKTGSKQNVFTDVALALREELAIDAIHERAKREINKLCELSNMPQAYPDPRKHAELLSPEHVEVLRGTDPALAAQVTRIASPEDRPEDRDSVLLDEPSPQHADSR